MLTTAYYFLQVILCSAVMMGYYWIVLRNKRFHQYNRFYLLAIALLSWIVPLIKIQWNKPLADNQDMMRFLSVVADNNSEMEETITSKGFQWNWDTVAAGIYFVVAGILLVLVIKALFRLYRLLQTHSCKNVDDVYLIFTQAKGTPFSFFSYIFWNEEIDIRSEAGKQILKHELTHVRQKHSIDKLFIQFLLVAGWFNPFFWLLRREMDMIHEFIADKKAINNGDTATLAQMLLAAAYPQQQFTLTHPFFFSPIKRRLHMLANNRNPRFTYLRRLIVLPLLAVVVVLFAFRNKEYKGKILGLDKKYTVVIDAGHGGQDIGAIGADGAAEKDIVLTLARKIKELNNNADLNILLTRSTDVYQPVTDKAKFANEQKADLFVSLHCNNAAKEAGPVNGAEFYIASKEKAKDYNANYRLANHIATAVGEISQLRGIHSSHKGIWVLQAVDCPSVLVEAGFMTNNSDLAKLKDSKYQEQFAGAVLNGIQHYLHAKENSTSADTTIRLTVTPELKKRPAKTAENTRVIIRDAKKENADTVYPNFTGKLTANSPLFIVDEKRTGINELNRINPNSISSVNVLKNESATLKYGADGKNGVVEITLKEPEIKEIKLKFISKDTIPNGSNKMMPQD